MGKSPAGERFQRDRFAAGSDRPHRWRRPDRPAWRGNAKRKLPYRSSLQAETPEEKSWLIFADASGLGDSLISQLREAGVRCRVARAGENFEFDGTDGFSLRPDTLEDWQKLIKACAETLPERIVYLWNLDARMDGGDDRKQSGRAASSHAGAGERGSFGQAAS